MHRTTTTATILVTVAVSTVSGCVTVERPLAPAAPSASFHPPKESPAGRSGLVMPGPAREALGRVGPPPEPPAPTPAVSHRPAPAPPPPPAAPRRAPHPPEPRSMPRRAEPRTAVPSAPDTLGVCALGEMYGGWAPDSPEAVICRRMYGG
ncbi:hypothetical protein [Streptomyces cavernae]|uniref:hypothetical protein n=1 Tax=Streptomyces cavernae TaxID=2259034 RepID=UPI000FEBCDDB|nr:hypothetical protein [Streptomyces cavernae]